MPRDRIDDNDSPINATSPELDALHRELARIESDIQKLNAAPYNSFNRTRLFYRNIQRDALRAQIKVWQQDENELPW